MSVSSEVSALDLQLKSIPEQAGVYQYFDKEGTLLYIGKAKSLKNRVLSYFREDKQHSPKISVLLKKIHSIQYIIVDNELDALLLENTLIKKYQPRYNSMLKDDKAYPWLMITQDAFPRLLITRHYERDGAQYFGPYPNKRILRELQSLVKRLFRYRNCKLPLNERDIQKGRFRSCISYQIGLCNAPCIGNESSEEYHQSMLGIRKLLRGDFNEILSEQKQQMEVYAQQMEYEKAQQMKEKIMLLEQYKSRSMIVGAQVEDTDVYSLVSDLKSAYINVMRIKKGAIVYSYSTEVKKHFEENDEEVLTQMIPQLHERMQSTAKEIIVPFYVDIPEGYAKQVVPKRGDKKQLLELSERNAKAFSIEKKKQSLLVDPERFTKRILEAMRKDLRMRDLPERIECFDNSNIQGKHAVAAMVCFINARPAKSEYRHFSIRTVEDPNDFASMEEVIYRRYKRVLEEGKELPQLVVIDGGKGQLSSAIKSIKQLGVENKMQVIGIAKRLEEIYFPHDPIPLHLDKRSDTLKVIQQLRDEAHRFGITHHRKKRSKATIFTSLTDIQGIGEKTARDLLLRFSSVKNIKKTSYEDLVSCIGKAKAKTVVEYFSRESDEGLIGE